MSLLQHHGAMPHAGTVRGFRVIRPLSRSLLWILLLLSAAFPLSAYSQFTHEEVIDLLWAGAIRSVLLAHYPGASDAELKRAHAYAYGGCLIQDIGYYPFGKGLFSDLAHYVRTGDFVVSMLRNAGNV